jgi:dienelactone hydrolase
MRPFYEEIQEDWSSLQIGVSKLEPLPPMVGEVDQLDRFTRVDVRVQWRPGDPIDLWIILPKGVKNPPAVIYLYGPGTQNAARFRDDRWCERAISGGVAAIGFEMALTGERFHDRPMKQTMLTELQEALGSTVHDVKFILDYLDKSGQFDMNRVGMFGDAVGGAVAILAAAADPRIKALDLLEPWGDWPDFLAKSPVIPDNDHARYITPEFLKKVAPLDPVKWLPELKIPIRIQQIKESQLVPMPCKEAIKAAAPKQTEVLRFAAVEDIEKRESGGRLFQWIKDKLQLPAPGAGLSAKVSRAEQDTDSKSRAKN